MLGLSEGKKNFYVKLSRLTTIPGCDRRTDRQTTSDRKFRPYA